MDLSTLTALTWIALIAAALFSLSLPSKESTGDILVFLPIADVIALWAYRRDANKAVLRRLVPSMLVGVRLGAPLRVVSAQTQMRRVIGASSYLQSEAHSSVAKHHKGIETLHP